MVKRHGSTSKNPFLIACLLAAWLCGAQPACAQSMPGEKGVGVNIEGVTDWSRSLMFADLMKQSRAWGSVSKPWDPATLPPESLDANGWPLVDAGVFISTIGGPKSSEPNAPYLPPGVYALSFTGPADVKRATAGTTVANYHYDAATGQSTADVVVGSNVTSLGLIFTGTQGGVRNVKLMRPGYAGTGKVFSDEFLAAIAPFSTLRLMDFLHTNSNTLKHWSERTTPDSASQQSPKGAALEYAIDLANLTGKDIWLNIPQGADDDYVVQMARLFRSRLSPSIHVYLEYSNELWNYQFSQTKANQADAINEVIAGNLTLTNSTVCSQADFDAKRGACDPYAVAQKRVAARTVQISQLFQSVYGAGEPGNIIRPVLAGQYVNPYGMQIGLDYIKRYIGSPANYLWGVASAPYFLLGNTLSQDPALTVDAIFDGFRTALSTQIYPKFSVGMKSGQTYVRGLPYTGSGWGASPQALARYWGLRSLAYEGGPDYGQNTVSLATKNAADQDPRMGALVNEFVSNWYACGNDMMMYYILSSAWGRYGYFGLTNDITNFGTAKMKGVTSALWAPATTSCL